MTAHAVMTATMRIAAPHCGHASGSTSTICRNSSTARPSDAGASMGASGRVGTTMTGVGASAVSACSA